MQPILWELKKEIYKILNSDESIKNMVNAIYHHIPENAVYPYIHLSKLTSKDWSCVSFTGMRCFLYINIYMQDTANKKVINVAEKIRHKLHNTNFDIDGGKVTSCMYMLGDLSLISEIKNIYKFTSQFEIKLKEN
jgi:hypothetical protein